MHSLSALAVTITGAVLVACASSDSKSDRVVMPDLDGGSQAEGAAFTADSMHFAKPMPSRPDWRPLEFYYKHCTRHDESHFYSKTQYDCTGP